MFGTAELPPSASPAARSANRPPEKRSIFLERVAARLQLHGPRFNADDLDRAVQMALRGLVQNSAA
jgi:hypothetical protein